MNSHTNNGNQRISDLLFILNEPQVVFKNIEKKVIVVNQDEADFSLLLIENLKEKFGNDIIVITQKQAIENNIFTFNPEGKTLKISSRPEYKEYNQAFSGKEKRRERRFKNRLDNQFQKTH